MRAAARANLAVVSRVDGFMTFFAEEARVQHPRAYQSAVGRQVGKSVGRVTLYPVRNVAMTFISLGQCLRFSTVKYRRPSQTRTCPVTE